ncbi:hypothetical protein BO82DRAFT_300919 [Aspergillus uvarum CBS 121591]|uniref:Protein kinase domain-containing protein n=1 Tax=Aspergillus uvarum CBS 121591 TaxID=1448315 RepID=A0A319CKJ5_9EURO|nr:hypothetical protein BO82DRAFT_300919 [Aspergillus uvarum CBS 121591]PYH86106.1 hypothetical protein BO82DRAFT_300919 [Aspergillus uvarum CBS 121591]
MFDFALPPQHLRTIKLTDGHEITATEAELLDPQRTVYRLKIAPDPAQDKLPTTPTSVIVKQQKEEWEDEFENEATAYYRLERLQGEVIPYFYSRGYFNGRSALILSDINGTSLKDLAYSNMETSEDLLKSLLEEAFSKLSEYGAIYRDQKLENFLLCYDKECGKSKIMVVDLEQVEFPQKICPWHRQINQEGARSLIEDFRYRRNPGRKSPPLQLWVSGNGGSPLIGELDESAPAINQQSASIATWAR